MAVHAQSVIPTWVNDYYPAFYVALTNQEEYAYDSAGGIHLTHWKTIFQTLVARMNTFKVYGRDLKDYISALYSWYLLSVMYSTPFDANAANAYTVFSMNGFMAACIGRATSYYNDLVETAPASGIWRSVKLGGDSSGAVTGAGDIFTVNGFQAPEDALRLSNETAARTSSAGIVQKALFNDIPLDNPPKTKQEMGEYIFLDLHHKQLQLAIGVGIDIPSYGTPELP